MNRQVGLSTVTIRLWGLCLIVLILTGAISVKRVTAEPEEPPVPTPAGVRRISPEHWNDKPESAAPTGEDNILPSLENQSTPVICYIEDAYEKANRYSWGVYSLYATGGSDWEVIFGPICELDTAKNISASPATDYDPRLSYDANKVVFVSDRDGNDEIYLYQDGGAPLRRLTFDAMIDTMPAFSPDNYRIAFVSDRSGYPEIYTVNIDGTGLKQLTNYHMTAIYPEWSPDGQKIVFTLRDGNKGVLVVMNADGSGASVLTPTVYWPGQARWSPSGDRLVFEVDGNLDGWFDLAILNADGSGLELMNAAQRGYDLDLGGWMSSETFLFCQLIRYEYMSDGYWHFASSHIRMMSLNQSDGQPIPARSGNALHSDVRNPDRLSPESHLDPLPRWVRANTPLQLSFTATDFGSSGLSVLWVYFYPGTQTPLTRSIPISGMSGHYTDPNPFTFAGGLMVNVSIRAGDLAGNREVIHQESDGVVGFYQYQAAGQILDVREHPLVGAQVQIVPEAMNLPVAGPDGATIAYFGSAIDPAQARFSYPGAVSLRPQSWPVTRDLDFLAVLPAADDQVQNGHFETADPVEMWQAEGDFAIQSKTGHDGKGIEITREIGQDLNLNPVEAVGPGGLGGIVVDQGGAYHVVNAQGEEWVRDPDGTWQNGPALPEGSYTGLVIGADDTMYIVRTTPTIDLFTRVPGNAWVQLSTPVDFSAAPDLAIDANGTLYTAYSIGLDVYYAKKVAGENWSTPLLVETINLMSPTPEIAVSPDGKAMIVVQLSGRALVLHLDESGQVVVQHYLYALSSTSKSQVQLAIAQDGTYYGVGREVVTGWNIEGGDCQQYRYTRWAGAFGSTTYTRESILSGPLIYDILDTSAPWGSVRFDANQTLHLIVFDSTLPDNNLVYQTHVDGQPDDQWQARKTTLDGSPLGLDYALGTNGAGGLLYGDGTDLAFRPLAVIPAPDTESISQSVTIPENMWKPTLSFFYRADAFIPGQGAPLEVLVQEPGSDAVIVYQQALNVSPWQHVWVDFSPWRGKTITLQFRINQAAGEYPAHIMLDEISLTSWATPLLSGNAPTELISVPPSGMWLHINGDNLIDGSQVYLNQYQLQPVIFDAQSGGLDAWLHPGISIGEYDLRVVTPVGIEGKIEGALSIGVKTFLPVVKK